MFSFLLDSHPRFIVIIPLVDFQEVGRLNNPIKITITPTTIPATEKIRPIDLSENLPPKGYIGMFFNGSFSGFPTWRCGVQGGYFRKGRTGSNK